MNQFEPKTELKPEPDDAATRKCRLGVRSAGTLASLSVAVLLAVSAKQCPSLPEDCSKLSSIDVGGYSLLYEEEGTGGPAVILMAGEDDNLTVWRKVLPEVGAFTTAIAYDRGGVGCSDQGENPRTPDIVSDELEAFLDAMGLTDPVILCGHSFGVCSLATLRISIQLGLRGWYWSMRRTN